MEYQEVEWSGIDIQMRSILPCDRTDETPKEQCITEHTIPMMRTMATVVAIGALVWDVVKTGSDFNYLNKNKLQDDINSVFTGEGYRIIKNHFLARKFNLDFIWNNFPGDRIVLIYREPQKSFAWWSEVMDFAPDHYPDYRPGYTDYNTMRDLLWKESSKITDFAMRKDLQFKPYNVTEFNHWEGFTILMQFESDYDKYR